MTDATAAPAAPDPVERTAKEILFVPVMACCANGHRFSKRVNKAAPERDAIVAAYDSCDEEVSVSELSEMLDSLTSVTYVCDVCDRCGLTVGLK